MKLHLKELEGWSYIRIIEEDPWHHGTFFPIIDTMATIIEEDVKKNNRPLIFDFCDLTHIDSILISLLIQAVRMCPQYRNSVIVPERTDDVLYILGIYKLMDVYFSLDDWRADRLTQGIKSH